MPMQHSLSLATPGDPGRMTVQSSRGRDGTSVFLVMGTSGAGSPAVGRLLERALSDSGLVAHEPRPIDAGDGLQLARWQRWAAQPPTVIAFGAEAASGFLNRPVSLNLERGRLRPLPDGGRMLVTEHPRAILGLVDPVARGREYRRLVNDLLMAVPHRRLAA